MRCLKKGKATKTGKFTDELIKIDLSKLNSGTYFIRLLNEKYYSEGEKISNFKCVRAQSRIVPLWI